MRMIKKKKPMILSEWSRMWDVPLWETRLRLDKLRAKGVVQMGFIEEDGRRVEAFSYDPDDK